MDPWRLTTPWGICRSDDHQSQSAVWHTGHTSAILSLEPDLLLTGIETGGVFRVRPDGSGEPLSHDWDNPDINWLARGPLGPSHVYAGCNLYYTSSPDVLYQCVNDIRSWAPLPITGTSGTVLNTREVLSIVVVNAFGTDRLCLACGTGVFWAEVPAGGTGYVFRQATFPPNVGGAFSTIAAGPNGTVIVGAWGVNKPGSQHFGIFVGTWARMGSILEFKRATVNGAQQSEMAYISLATCRDRPERGYALSGHANDFVFTVLRSDDGGQNWNPTGTTVKGQSKLLFGDLSKDTLGNQQAYNNALAVSFDNPDVVCLGLRAGAISTDGGATWSLIDDTHREVHADVQSLHFGVDPTGQQCLFLGTDGGVAASTDLGGTFNSMLNRRVPGLQFAGYPGRQDYGVFSASRRENNLMAGGSQDNGILVGFLGYDDEQPWREFMDMPDDGKLARFLANGEVIHYRNDLPKPQRAAWNADAARLQDLQEIAQTGSTLDLKDMIVEEVDTPTFRLDGQLMLAVGCINETSKNKGHVFGFFIGDDNSQPQWRLLRTIDLDMQTIPGPRPMSDLDVLTAIESRDGNRIVLGTKYGDIHWIEAPPPPGQTFTDVPIAQPGIVAFVYDFIYLHDALIFAMVNNTSTNVGDVWRFDGTQWVSLRNLPRSGLPSEMYYSIERDDRDNLYLATDRKVYMSINRGELWSDISAGLPARPHGACLAFAVQPDGRKMLYLATWGWSVWHVDLSDDKLETNRVTVDVSGLLVDDDFPDDETKGFTFPRRVVRMGPNQPKVELYFEGRVGGEVRGELRVTLEYVPVTNEIKVTHNTKLYEGTSESTSDLDAEETGTMTVLRGANQTASYSIENDEILSADKVDVNLRVENQAFY